MRKKAFLCMIMAGVLVLGCGCGKSEDKGADSSVQISSIDSSSESGSGEETKKEEASTESSSEETKTGDASTENSGEETKKEEASTASSGEETKKEEASTASSGEETKKEDASKESSGEETKKEDSSKESSGEETKTKDNASQKDAGEDGAFDKDGGKTLDRIFEDCASIGEGVAGVSLKRTQQAYEVARYAAKNRFTEASLEQLKKAFAERYEKLDSEEKESFDGAFEGEIIELLDEAIVKGHFENVRDQFDDVGEAEDMEKLLSKKGLKESFHVIKEAYSALR